MELFSEQEKMWLENQALVGFMINKLNLQNQYPDYEELQEVGLIGLYKAVNTYNKENGTFANYACKCIQNEIFMLLRKHRRTKTFEVISMETPIQEDYTLEATIPDSKADFESVIFKRSDFFRRLEYALNYFSTKYRIVLLLTIASKNQPQIAEILGCSQSYISRLINRCNFEIKDIPEHYSLKSGISVKTEYKVLKVTFSMSDIENYKCFLEKLFKDIGSKTLKSKLVENLNFITFEMECSEDKLVLKLPFVEESFLMIAFIIEQIEIYKVVAKGGAL